MSAARTRGGVKNQDAMATNVLRQTENHNFENPVGPIAKSLSSDLRKHQNSMATGHIAQSYLPQALSSYGHRHLEGFCSSESSSRSSENNLAKAKIALGATESRWPYRCCPLTVALDLVFEDTCYEKTMRTKKNHPLNAMRNL